MSFDVAWSPDCIDGRCYDALALSKVVDFLVVMAYDEQSQIKTGECIAKANSPINQTRYGNCLVYAIVFKRKNSEHTTLKSHSYPQSTFLLVSMQSIML